MRVGLEHAGRPSGSFQYHHLQFAKAAIYGKRIHRWTNHATLATHTQHGQHARTYTHPTPHPTPAPAPEIRLLSCFCVGRIDTTPGKQALLSRRGVGARVLARRCWRKGVGTKVLVQRCWHKGVRAQVLAQRCWREGVGAQVLTQGCWRTGVGAKAREVLAHRCWHRGVGLPLQQHKTQRVHMHVL